MREENGKRCTRCFGGMIVGGTCTRCHHPEQLPEHRKATALPLNAYLNNRYYIGDVLGSGGFGITYSAWDKQNNRCVALKELFPSRDVVRMPDKLTVRSIQGQEDYFKKVSQCFVNEANILIRLRGQDGVVTIYDYFAENGTLYYSMEYLEGVDLKTYYTQNPIVTWDMLSQIIKPVLQGLNMLHSMSLIHRDISPDNIFITGENHAQLIDFGSVRTYQGAKSFTTFMKQSFAPWEQYQTDGNQGPWTDIYALCVTLYYVMSRKLPPNATERKLNDTVEPITKYCPTLPPNVASAIMRGMAVNIQDRYSSVRELAQDLFPEKPTTLARLICQRGFYQGNSWQLVPNMCLKVGRQSFCQIHYPEELRQISGTHCSIMMNPAGQILVRDDNSTNGTWIDDRRLSAGVWYKVPRGCHIRVVFDEYVVQ